MGVENVAKRLLFFFGQDSPWYCTNKIEVLFICKIKQKDI